MTTLRQATLRHKRKQKIKKQKYIALQGGPQKRGVCVKIYTLTPRKPCSARRAVTRVRLSTRKIVTCHIPGIGHNLKKYSAVLVRGGRPNDLPAVKYRAIRAARRTDFYPSYLRKKARSKYGCKNIFRIHRVRKSRGLGIKPYYRF